MINLDWLSFHAKGSPVYPDYMSVIVKEYGTTIFKTIEEIYMQNELTFTVVREPRSSILPPDTVIIKVSNRELYKGNAASLCLSFMEKTGLMYRSITRLDICKDFSTFAGGLTPNKFITNFMNNKYLKTKKTKYTVIGNQTTEHIYEYLRIGTNTSEISGYLYNKSNEMRDKIFKNYIFESWQANNIDTSKDVWRLEFSLKNGQTFIFNPITNKRECISLQYLDDISYINSIYWQLYNTNWEFKLNDGTMNKSRMKTINLFADKSTQEKVTFETLSKDPSRQIKGVINFLEKLNIELRQLGNYDKDEIKESARTISKIYDIEYYRLMKWAP